MPGPELPPDLVRTVADLRKRVAALEKRRPHQVFSLDDLDDTEVLYSSPADAPAAGDTIVWTPDTDVAKFGGLWKPGRPGIWDSALHEVTVTPTAGTPDYAACDPIDLSDGVTGYDDTKPCMIWVTASIVPASSAWDTWGSFSVSPVGVGVVVGALADMSTPYPDPGIEVDLGQCLWYPAEHTTQVATMTTSFAIMSGTPAVKGIAIDFDSQGLIDADVFFQFITRIYQP